MSQVAFLLITELGAGKGVVTLARSEPPADDLRERIQEMWVLCAVPGRGRWTDGQHAEAGTRPFFR